MLTTLCTIIILILDNTGADISTEQILSIKYFNLFTSNPATGDQTSNPLELHDSKSAVERDPPPAEWARTGNTAVIPPAKIPLSAFAPSQTLRVQRTQRNITLGNWRFIDKSSDISNIPVNDWIRTRLATLSDDSKFFITTSAINLRNLSLDKVKFYRLKNNSDNTDYTIHEVTLDTGVTLPTDFSVNMSNGDIIETHDDKVLVVGGRRTPTSRYADNHNMFVLTVNHLTNKITNIRKLQSTLTLPRLNDITRDGVNFSIYKKSSGDFFVGIYDSSTNSRGFEFTFSELVIGESSDSVRIKLTNTSMGSAAQSAITYFDIIEKTNFSYIFIPYYERGSLNKYAVIRIKNSNNDVHFRSDFSVSGATNLWVIGNYPYIKLLDGRYYGGGYIYPALADFDDDPQESTTILASKKYIPNSSISTRTQLFSLPSYTSDAQTPSQLTYSFHPAFILSDGSFGDILVRVIYNGTSFQEGIKITAQAHVPVTGDIQTVISRRLLDSATFDTANAVFIRDELKSLTGANRLPVSAINDGIGKSEVPQQFRTDADTTGQLFQPKCFWLGTSTQLTAATKVENCVYMVPKTSQ